MCVARPFTPKRNRRVLEMRTAGIYVGCVLQATFDVLQLCEADDIKPLVIADESVIHRHLQPMPIEVADGNDSISREPQLTIGSLKLYYHRLSFEVDPLQLTCAR